MKPSAIILALTVGMSTAVLTAQEAPGAPPDGAPPPRQGGPRLLPPGAQEQLKLTAEQQKQLADLEAEVKEKLAKILTPEQLEQLKQIRPPQRPPAPREGGAGGGERGAGAPGEPAPPPRPPQEE